MGLGRWFYEATAGVEDFAEGADETDASSRRRYVYYTIDHSPFQKWVVFVAGVGFFTDAYDIFALNVVIPILEVVYWDGYMPQAYETALIVSTLIGTLIGQAMFGFFADVWGRRKMYGTELIVVVASTLGVAMSASGAMGSMSITGWLIFWRFTMGIGIGADYPLSAVICSEYSPRKHRSRMMATVFACQPIGQLLGILVSLVVIAAYKQHIPDDSTQCDDGCIRALDSAWRWIVGFGSLPAVVALFFRLTIPESPRYLLDVAGAIKGAAKDTEDYYGGAPYGQNQEMMERGQPQLVPSYDRGGRLTPQHTRDGASEASPITRPISDHSGRLMASSPDMRLPSPTLVHSSEHDDVIQHDLGYEEANRHSFESVRSHDAQAPPDQPPQASWEDAKKFFITEKNWYYLAATSGTWFCLDFAFYALSLSLPAIVHSLWRQADECDLYPTLLDNTTGSLVLLSIGTMLGSGLMIIFIKHWSSRDIQFYGFIILTVLLIVLGGIFTKLQDPDFKGAIIVIYILCQIFFNLGPNTTTFIIPAEIFPTRYRAASHGISAAFGKLGSIIGRVFLEYVRYPSQTKSPSELDENKRCPNTDPDAQTRLGWSMMILAIFMIIGAVWTWYGLPETRDKKGKSRSLEVMAQGRVKMKELGKKPAVEDQCDCETCSNTDNS